MVRIGNVGMSVVILRMSMFVAMGSIYCGWVRMMVMPVIMAVPVLMGRLREKVAVGMIL